ncbi:hypothetical protein C8R45DRAFT_170614 [Mycena sanguinolenta]|nr:hypothetical protein C8R45DRAFT_170614 [Mycena sanguinolenta]
MPPWRVPGGQIRTGLRFLARSLSVWGKPNKDNSDEQDSADAGRQSTDRHISHLNLRAQSSPPPSPPSLPLPSPPPPPTCVAPCVLDSDPRIAYSSSLSQAATSPSASATTGNSTHKASKGTPSKELVGILAGVLGSAVFILICITAVLIVLMRRRRRRAQRFQSSLFTTTESMDVAARERSSYYTDSLSNQSQWFSHPRSPATKSWISSWIGFDTKSTSQQSK